MPKTSIKYLPCSSLRRTIKLLFGVQLMKAILSFYGKRAQHFECLFIGLYSNTVFLDPPKILPDFYLHKLSAVKMCSVTSTPNNGNFSTSKVKMVFLAEIPIPFNEEKANLP
jgi:hypothetical protein